MRSWGADHRVPGGVVVGLLAAVALLGACVETIELAGDVPADAGGEPGADGGPGDAGLDGGMDAGGCATTDDCPTGRCVDGACDADARCASASEACGVDGDCCNGHCDEGRCATLPGCLGVEEACDVDADCCSGACEPVGEGGRRCLDLGGCRPAGELCRRDADCCNVLASPACVIFDGDRGLGRCAAPTGCLPPGELCDRDAVVCCDEGEWSGDELDCEDTTAAERVSRCMSEAAEEVCREAGIPCAIPEECCSGRCTPALRCG